MAIDFPNSPTLNQIYTVGSRSWIWDGSTWNIYANVPNRYIQDAPPSSPQSGDQWFESDTGRLFVYYDSAWVEIGNATDIAGALQPKQVTDLTAITSLTTDDVFPVIDNPSSATAANKITYGNLVTAMSSSLAPGMVLVKTQTIGSAVSSVEVTSAFSSTYDNYWVTLTGGVCSTTTVLNMTLGSTSTGYYFAGRNLSYSSVATDVAGSNNSRWEIGVGTTDNLYLSATLFMPNLTKRTMMTSGYVYGNPSGGGDVNSFGGYLNNATSYTAFTISTTSGTMTGGTIRVYGYRNS